MVNELVEANVFVQDNEGFKVHFKVPLLKEAIVPEITAFLEDLHEAGFVPDATFKASGGAAPAKPAPRPSRVARGNTGANGGGAGLNRQQAGVRCMYCNGATYDNRESKQSETQPDYRCRDRSGCGAAAWEQDNGELRWSPGRN